MLKRNFKEDTFTVVPDSYIKEYGPLKAIILAKIVSYINYNGQTKGEYKFYKSIKSLAEIMGIPLRTFKDNLPTEEMGIKHYAGYIPGALTKTTWWEYASPALPESANAAPAKESAASARSLLYNKDNNKDLAETAQTPPKSFVGSQHETSGSPFSVDVKKVNRSGSKENPNAKAAVVMQELLDIAGTASTEKRTGLVIQIRRMMDDGITAEQMRVAVRNAKIAYDRGKTKTITVRGVLVRGSKNDPDAYDWFTHWTNWRDQDDAKEKKFQDDIKMAMRLGI